jgi:hypothetical protein
MTALSRLLDRLLGPRDWMVIEAQIGGLVPADVHAIPASRYNAGTDVVLHAGLRSWAAFRLARKLREQRLNAVQELATWPAEDVQ